MLLVPKWSDSHPPPAGGGEMIVLSGSSLPLVEDPDFVARRRRVKTVGKAVSYFFSQYFNMRRSIFSAVFEAPLRSFECLDSPAILR